MELIKMVKIPNSCAEKFRLSPARTTILRLAIGNLSSQVIGRTYHSLY